MIPALAETTPAPRSGVDASVAAPLLVVHLAALALAPFTVTRAGLWTCLGLYLFTGLGVTAGAHRLFAHRSFQPAPLLRDLLALAFLLSAQGSLRRWVRDHAIHHRYSDGAGDPHSPLALGFWGAHLFWLWKRPPTAEQERALYRRWTRGLEVGRLGGFFRSGARLGALHLGGLATLFAVGTLAGDARLGLSLVVWGGAVRIVLVLHSTFLVNSATHLFGGRAYPTGDASRNTWWVALLALGEGWHNNHHHRPAAGNNGFHRPWEVDLTFLFLLAMGALGLLRDLKVYVAARDRVETWFPGRTP